MDAIWVLMLGTVVVACVIAVVVAMWLGRKGTETPEGRCWRFGEDADADCRYCDHWRDCDRYDKAVP